MNYYDLKITGRDVKRFINNLYRMGINFYNIKYLDKNVIIKVNRNDYLKIKQIKTIYEIEIVNYYGIVKYNSFINKYKIFLIILVIGFILFLGLTNIIFDVEVVHNNKELKELIMSSLEEEGISKYKFCVSFKKKEKIKKNLLDKYKDKIEYLEIKRSGTKYIILVEERKSKNNKQDNTPCDIVAKKSGVITKISASSGEVIVKKDQYVKKGDILISGSIHKNDNIVANVKAEGNVYAETWYTVSVELPYHYYEKYKTNNSKKSIGIKFLNKSIRFNKYKSYDSDNIYSIKNHLLPIEITLDKLSETKVVDQVYTMENASFKAKEIAKKRLIESIGEDIQITFEKKLKSEQKNSKIYVVMFYKVIENITNYKDVDLIVGN